VFPSAFRVVVDACALFPLNLRDTLLRAAERDLYQLYWSAEILDEMHRNLVEKGFMTEAKAQRSRAVMEEAFPESMVVGYESLVAAMGNHAKDRHVAAAAVKAGAQVIVTANLRDFTNLPDPIEAQHPDQFLCYLFDLDPDGMVELLTEQAKDRKRPPISLAQMLEAMAKVAPDFVATVLAYLGHANRQQPSADLEQVASTSSPESATPSESLTSAEPAVPSRSADDPNPRPRSHLRSVT
jgi:predicted nucleic acid-binding protein